MIFKNMETLKVTSVDKVIKAGDTISDIREGKTPAYLRSEFWRESSLVRTFQGRIRGLPEEERK